MRRIEKRRKLRETKRKRLCDYEKPHGRRLFIFVLFRHLVVEVQAKHKSLVVGVRAANVCALDNAAFENICYTHDLAEYRKKAAVFFAISHVRFVRTNELSRGVLKSDHTVCSAFRPAKNDANSAQRKEKGYARFGKYPVRPANTFRTTQLESKSTTRTIAASAGATSL